MAARDEVEAHDFYERLRPVLEEYFDNWLICGHRAGDKNELHLGTQSRSGMGVLTTIMQDEDLEYSYGKTYVQSLVLWIPRAIWVNRPLDAPRSFVRLHMKEWKPRHGLGYFPLAEAYQNFGVIGAFIQFLIFGVIWGAFWNLFRKLFANYLQIIIYVYLTQFMLFFGIYMLIMVRRGASNTLYFPSHLLSFQFGLFKK